MGAELVGYMIIGPTMLDDRKVDVAVERAERTLKAAAAFIDWGNDPDKPNAVPKRILNALKHVERDVGEIDSNDLEAVIHRTTNVKEVVEQLFELWNGDGMPDSMSRVVGDRRVVFAGTETWGDEPDGLGFQLIKQALFLGLFDILEIEQ